MARSAYSGYCTDVVTSALHEREAEKLVEASAGVKLPVARGDH